MRSIYMLRKILMSMLLTFTLNAGDNMKSLYDISVTNNRGQEVSMLSYKGKVLLIVNVASECGFTSQYDGLEKLYKKYHTIGLEVLAFPSNQFAGQEPGSDEQIANFCKVNFGITFPLFTKIDVNGKNTDPLYQYLKEKASGFLGTKDIKWNFTKFLINREGKVVKRYGSSTKPAKIAKDIEKLLKM